MAKPMGVSTCVLVAVAALATASVASAQEGPVAPSAISLTGPSTPTPPAAVGPATPSAAPPTIIVAQPAKQAAPEEYGPNDHDRVLHHIGVGYFGISQLPVGVPNATTSAIVNAPVIGLRYWASRMVGIDVGLGFGYSHNGTSGGGTGTGPVNQTNDAWGFALHAGLPLSLGSSRHFSFELVPIEATLGFAGGSAPGAITGLGTALTDSLSGFRVDVGARIGAELQFGFIGIPQLALEGSIGLYVQHQSWGSTPGNSMTTVGGNTTTFATSVGSDPWAIFTDTISALYYF